MNISFAGKTVIITGGAGGFGRKTAQSFAEAGANVVVSDIDASRAAEVAGELPSAVAIAADVTREADIQRLIHSTELEYGQVDIMVNNAGVPHLQQPMIELTADDVDRQYAVNLRSVFLGAKYAATSMLKSGGGVIVNVASIAGKRPRPGLTIYNATKGAVITLTRGLATELGPEIRVNAVNPLVAQTGFIKQATGSETLTESATQSMTANVPMGRIATPCDVANAILFLASEPASFLTGVCLDVDGGRSIQ